MTTLWREFFMVNQTIVLFVYGQVFFVLGLAIMWQSRRHSRLDLARSLGWLGAFGLAHGLHEWGDIFIPIQAEYLDPVWVDVLWLVQLTLLACSFAALFQFGVEALHPLYPGLAWIRAIPAGLLLLWATAFLWTSQVFRWDPTELLAYAGVWARYLLGFPGALAAALGLRQQARRRIRVQEFPHIAQMFQVASLALAAYAIFSGLFVPPASFFPANVLNADTVINLLGIPPQVLRSLAGLVLVISVVRGLEIFEVEVDRRLEEMEQAQILLAERERVSRELHDGAIQTVYTAGLLSESIRKKMDKDDPLATRMDRVISALDHAIGDLRQFIGELEPDRPGENLIEGLRRLAEDPNFQALLNIEMNVNGLEKETLSPLRIAHVLAIVNEALSNIVRHAQAHRAWISVEPCDEVLQVKVSDDGIGLNEAATAGFGLRNMRDRARLLGGTLQLDPRPPHGTQVLLTIPKDDA